MKRQKSKQLWDRVFPLRIGDRVKVRIKANRFHSRFKEGIIVVILTESQKVRRGRYAVKVEGAWNNPLFCRREELEKIG